MTETPPPRRRHLMDPNQPRRPADPEALARLQRVQQWVMSVLVVTTVFHLSAGLVLLCAAVDEDRLDARIGLNVLGAASMVAGIAAARGIHRKPILSPWLLLGLLPGLLGLWFFVIR